MSGLFSRLWNNFQPEGCLKHTCIRAFGALSARLRTILHCHHSLRTFIALYSMTRDDTWYKICLTTFRVYINLNKSTKVQWLLQPQLCPLKMVKNPLWMNERAAQYGNNCRRSDESDLFINMQHEKRSSTSALSYTVIKMKNSWCDKNKRHLKLDQSLFHPVSFTVISAAPLSFPGRPLYWALQMSSHYHISSPKWGEIDFTDPSHLEFRPWSAQSVGCHGCHLIKSFINVQLCCSGTADQTCCH